MQKALGLTEELHGEEHPACVLVHMGYANLHQLHKQHEKALDHLHRAWEIKEEECHANGGVEGENEELAEIYAELGKVYCITGQDEEGLDMYARALRIYTARNGIVSKATARIAVKLATVESKIGRYEEAVTHFEVASTAMEGIYGDGHKKTVEVWRKLCLLLVKLKQYDAAEELLQRVLDRNPNPNPNPNCRSSYRGWLPLRKFFSV